ncbi:hypothetical protein DSECCO2_323250 [anaerobic digester metagenome]
MPRLLIRSRCSASVQRMLSAVRLAPGGARAPVLAPLVLMLTMFAPRNSPSFSCLLCSHLETLRVSHAYYVRTSKTFGLFELRSAKRRSYRTIAHTRSYFCYPPIRITLFPGFAGRDEGRAQTLHRDGRCPATIHLIGTLLPTGDNESSLTIPEPNSDVTDRRIAERCG